MTSRRAGLIALLSASSMRDGVLPRANEPSAKSAAISVIAIVAIQASSVWAIAQGIPANAPQPSSADAPRASTPSEADLTLINAAEPAAVDETGDYQRESFESQKSSWILTNTAPSQWLVEHRRQSRDVRSGRSAEFLLFRTPGRENEFGLVHDLQTTPVFNELKVKVWVKSNRPGVQVLLRVHCPRAIDPETRKPVVFGLRGTQSTKTGEWEELVCSTSDDAIRRRVTSLRTQLRELGATETLDFTEMYVEAVELRLGLKAGATALLIDDLQFGPLVTLESAAASPESKSLLRQIPAPLDLSGGHMRLHRRPFVPLMTHYRGEPTDLLSRRLGINVVALDRSRLEELGDIMQAAGLWVTTAPPSADHIASLSTNRAGGSSSSAMVSVSHTANSVFDETERRTVPIDGAVNATPASIGNGTENVLFWNLGMRIPATELEAVNALIDGLSQSDRLYSRPRPVFGDVADRERAFSRRLDMTGSSVPFLHSTLDAAGYFAELDRCRRETLAGNPKLAWIATEPSPAVQTAIGPADWPAIVEPEQILMQAELALAAGNHGLGFWQRTSLAGNGGGDDERRAAIEIIARRCQLLEPWIATSEFVGLAPVTVGPRTDERSVQPPIVAAVFQSEYGILVRFVWCDSAGQHVPGPMSARDVRAIVRAGEQPQAYLISPTGIRSIDAKVKAGGTEIKLDTFDQSATVLITGYEGVVAKVREVIRDQRVGAAEAWLRMASAKLDRVRETNDRLDAVSLRPIAWAAALLSDAKLYTNRAEDAFASEDYETTRQQSQAALQLVRRLQRAHWDAAVREIGSPQASTHALCFSTLPDFWADVSRERQSTPVPIALSGGDFADAGVMQAAGWQNVATSHVRLAGAIELAPSNAPDGRSIRLAAADVDGADPLAVRATLETPPLYGEAGDELLLTARIRAIDGRKSGLLRVSDSRLGPILGVEKRAPVGRWETLAIRRPFPTEGQQGGQSMRIRFELLGSGGLFIDDVNAQLVKAPKPEISIVPEVAPAGKKRRNPLRLGNPLELLPQFPELPDLRRFPSWLRDPKASPPAEPEASASGPKTPDDREPSGSPADDAPLILPTIRPGHGVVEQSGER